MRVLSMYNVNMQINMQNRSFYGCVLWQHFAIGRSIGPVSIGD